MADNRPAKRVRVVRERLPRPNPVFMPNTDPPVLYAEASDVGFEKFKDAYPIEKAREDYPLRFMAFDDPEDVVYATVARAHWLAQSELMIDHYNFLANPRHSKELRERETRRQAEYPDKFKFIMSRIHRCMFPPIAESDGMPARCGPFARGDHVYPLTRSAVLKQFGDLWDTYAADWEAGTRQ